MNPTITETKKSTPLKSNKWLLGSIVVFALVWLSTFIWTNDMNNWLIENALVFLSLAFLVGTYRMYRFSNLSYVLISVFLCLHVYGSQYTYAENPFGFWMMEVFDHSRNHYDRLVHFSFGLLLVYPMREMFIHWLGYPRSTAWLLPIVTTLAVSAVYELIEWAVAEIFFPAQGPAYLGTQGDVWDAQKDTFLAFLGATITTILIMLVPGKRKASHS
jgi:putative membrane protein